MRKSMMSYLLKRGNPKMRGNLTMKNYQIKRNNPTNPVDITTREDKTTTTMHTNYLSIVETIISRLQWRPIN